MPTLLGQAEGNNHQAVLARSVGIPRGLRPQGIHGSNLRENREILRPPKPARLGRIEKSKDVRR